MLNTKGIIFRTVKFKESSLVLDVYTEAKGLLSMFMNGVYSSKSSRLSSILQIGQMVDLTVYYSEKKELHRIKEVTPDFIYTSIPNQIHKSAMATFMIELSRQAIKDREAHTDLYQFIKRCLVLLDSQETLDVNYHLRYMLKLCSYLGIQANNNYSSINNSFDLLNAGFTPYVERMNYLITPDLSHLLSQLMNDQVVMLQYEKRKLLLNILLQYYKIHVEHFGELKSPQVYQSIL